MNPSKLDDDAVKYELVIRGLPYESSRAARALLRQRLKDEKDDPDLRPPKVPEDIVDEEVTELKLYFNLHVQEMARTSLFLKGDALVNSQVYARLCFVEGRMARISRTTIKSKGTLGVWDGMVAEVKEVRAEHFSDKPLYIIPKQITVQTTEENDDASGEESEKDENSQSANVLKFTDEDRLKMEEFEKLLEEMRQRQALCEEYERSFAVPLDEESEEDDDDDDDENRVQQERENRGVDPGPHPPGQSKSGQQTKPRKSDPRNPFQTQIPSPAHKNVGESSHQFNSTMFPSQTFKPQTLPPHKWQISFSGENDGSVISFIRDAENMAKAQFVDLSVLCFQIQSLLKGKAANWYRVYGVKCSSWSELTAQLKEEYLPRNFGHQIMYEILGTRQSEMEKFHDFCVRMELLFMKLPHELSEDQKLSYLKDNMRDEYKYHGIESINTINELKSACSYRDSVDHRFKKKTEIKSTKAAAKVFAIESSPTDCENSWRSRTEEEDCDEEEIQQQIAALAQKLSTTGGYRSPADVCFNCDKKGHRHATCPEPKKQLFCYRCGKKNFHVNNCPDCAVRNARRNNNQSGNQRKTQ
jgi:hypothetical protein